MSRWFTVVGCLALLLPCVPTAAQAQEEERGSLGMVMWIELAPADRAPYREAMETLVEASQAAALPFAFHFWSYEAGYALYYPVDNMAYFDDPMQFWAAFEGTPGQAGRDEFMAAIQQIPAHVTSEVNETIPGAYYWPEGFTDEDWDIAYIHFDWLNPGQYEAWKELAGELVAFLEKIDYPFGAQAFETMIGEDRMAWVFYAPSLSEFHSEAVWEDLIEAAGAEAEWEAWVERWIAAVARWSQQDFTYVESMSYVPEE